MNEPVRKGNVYRSFNGVILVVMAYNDVSVTVVNPRTYRPIVVKSSTLHDDCELIGIPFTGTSK